MSDLTTSFVNVSIFVSSVLCTCDHFLFAFAFAYEFVSAFVYCNANSFLFVREILLDQIYFIEYDITLIADKIIIKLTTLTLLLIFFLSPSNKFSFSIRMITLEWPMP